MYKYIIRYFVIIDTRKLNKLLHLYFQFKANMENFINKYELQCLSLVRL